MWENPIAVGMELPWLLGPIMTRGSGDRTGLIPGACHRLGPRVSDLRIMSRKESGCIRGTGMTKIRGHFPSLTRPSSGLESDIRIGAGESEGAATDAHGTREENLMRQNRLMISVAAAIGLSLIAATCTHADAYSYDAADADEQASTKTFFLKGRVAFMNPNSSSNPIATILNSGSEIGDDTGFGIDAGWRFSDELAVEFSNIWTSHDMTGANSIVGLGKIGEADLWLPSLTLQYHFQSEYTIRPYVGIGFNYASFYSEKTTPAFDTFIGGVSSLKLDDGFGVTGQVGVDFDINNDFFVNLDAKYHSINSAVRFNTTGTERAGDLDVNPWVISGGLGMNF